MTIDRNRLAMGAAASLSLLMLQVAVMRLSPVSMPVRIVLPLTVALTPFALWPLRRYAGVWAMFVGLVANLAAILANGGLMPITHATVADAIGVERAAEHAPGNWIRGSKDVVVEPGGGRLTALGDSIIVRVGGGGVAASPGDVVIWAGVLLLAGQASLEWQRRTRHHSPENPAPTFGAEGSATTPP